MAITPDLHTIPVVQRPPKTWAQTANLVGFTLVFNLGAGMTHLVQLCVLLPLAIIGFVFPGAHGDWVRSIYEDGARYCKGACATLLGESGLTQRCESGQVFGRKAYLRRSAGYPVVCADDAAPDI